MKIVKVSIRSFCPTLDKWKFILAIFEGTKLSSDVVCFGFEGFDPIKEKKLTSEMFVQRHIRLEMNIKGIKTKDDSLESWLVEGVCTFLDFNLSGTFTGELSIVSEPDKRPGNLIVTLD